MTATVTVGLPPTEDDEPRPISRKAVGGDAWFRRGLGGVAAFVLAITGAIGIFLGYKNFPDLVPFVCFVSKWPLML